MKKIILLAIAALLFGAPCHAQAVPPVNTSMGCLSGQSIGNTGSAIGCLSGALAAYGTLTCRRMR